MYVSVLSVYLSTEHERFWKIYKSAGWVKRNLVPLLWSFENSNPRVESAVGGPSWSYAVSLAGSQHRVWIDSC